MLRPLRHIIGNFGKKNINYNTLQIWSRSSSTKTSYKHPTEPNVIVSKYETLAIPSETIYDYVWKKIDKWEDKTAVVCGVTGRGYSYSEAYKMCKSLASSLRKKFKVNDGDCVAIMMPNSCDYPLALLGSMQAGCTVTVINPLYKSDEIVEQLSLSKAKIVITIPECYGECKKAFQKMQKDIPVLVAPLDPRIPCPDGTIKFSELVESNNEDKDSLRAVKISTDETVLLPFSSGTTGLPKGVQLTHKNLTINMEQMSHIDPYLTTRTHQEVVIAVLPFFHIYALSCILLNKLSLGWKIVTLPKFTPELFLTTQEKHKSTQMFLVPPLVHFLNSHPSVKSSYFDTVNTIYSGAAPLATTDIEKLLTKCDNKAHFLQAYGMSETSPIVSIHERGNENYGSIGKLVNNTEVKIVKLDDFTNTCGPREEGELWIRGPQVMKGYLENPSETKEVLRPDGWLRTGDIGYYDDNEDFYVTDRLKELIKVKGFPVAPAELEASLRTHPDVIDAAVIGIPHKEYGEIPTAFVVQKPNSSSSPQDIMKYIEERVANYKKLGSLQFVPSIPRSPAGKILRKNLKEDYSS